MREQKQFLTFITKTGGIKTPAWSGIFYFMTQFAERYKTTCYIVMKVLVQKSVNISLEGFILQDIKKTYLKITANSCRSFHRTPIYPLVSQRHFCLPLQPVDCTCHCLVSNFHVLANRKVWYYLSTEIKSRLLIKLLKFWFFMKKNDWWIVACKNF